jgi:hypothetical protein
MKELMLGEVGTILQTLQRAIGIALKDDKVEEFPLVMQGVREAVTLVGHSANHARLPSLTAEFVQRMIKSKVITDKDKAAGKTARQVSMLRPRSSNSNSTLRHPSTMLRRAALATAPSTDRRRWRRGWWCTAGRV